MSKAIKVLATVANILASFGDWNFSNMLGGNKFTPSQPLAPPAIQNKISIRISSMALILGPSL
jgi:hypothetical protein